MIYRDFVDNDVFGDFGVLFLDNFYIINAFKTSKKGDKESMQLAIDQILAYMKSD